MNWIIDTKIAVPGFTVDAQCELHAGVTAFAGPSGSGKSLTLSAIAGLVRPATGHIACDGETVFDSDTNVHRRSQERGIGMVFQAPALLEHRNPRDNVALAVIEEKKSVRREMAMHWLQRVGAEHLATKNTRQLSGGERQRISLARALVNGGRTLLLDEPFTALDRSSRASMRQLVSEICEAEALTVVIVSHDVDDIVSMASCVILFEPGATVGTFEVKPGNAESVIEILSHPRHP